MVAPPLTSFSNTYAQYSGASTPIHIPLFNQHEWASLNEMQTKKEEKKTMFKTINEYISQHRNVLLTIVVAIILDKVVLKGKLTQKIHDVINDMVDNIGKQKTVGGA